MDMKHELDRRIRKGVRNIVISPLFEKDKHYNIDSNSKNYQKEDANGTLYPDRNHCWLTWESKVEYTDENGILETHWSKEAFSFDTITQAEEGKKYLERKLI